MKTVKISITVPEPLFKFAERRAQKVAKRCLERPNISKVFKDLLAEERERSEQPKTSAMA